MSVALVTGSAGLIGSETVRHFAGKGMDVVGIDNDLRSYFFGPAASTDWMRRELEATIPNYRHFSVDIRDQAAIFEIFGKYARDISLIVHTAAQPSHDWAAREPLTDFSVNATGTLILLEATRQFCPEAAFMFTSTNKVYGDSPNSLPLIEQDTRWEVDPSHPFALKGVNEEQPIDQSLHSVFGASKVAADVMVQEYGRYFGLKTACFRAGCLTGPNHAGAQLHGFLSYLMRCNLSGTRYKVLGYKGKQVRDNMHARDLVRAFDRFSQAPRAGEVYNLGGSRFSNCSMLEAIALCQKISGREMDWEYDPANRTGDHIWWITDITKFQSHYPGYELKYDSEGILSEIHDTYCERWRGVSRTAQAR